MASTIPATCRYVAELPHGVSKIPASGPSTSTSVGLLVEKTEQSRICPAAATATAASKHAPRNRIALARAARPPLLCSED